MNIRAARVTGEEESSPGYAEFQGDERVASLSEADLGNAATVVRARILAFCHSLTLSRPIC
jgi:hypothetical protein